LSASGSAASEGLLDALALASAGNSTPASFTSCITVSSGNCVQLLLKFRLFFYNGDILEASFKMKIASRISPPIPKRSRANLGLNMAEIGTSLR